MNVLNNIKDWVVTKIRLFPLNTRFVPLGKDRQQSWSQLWVRRWLQASCLLVCSGDGSVPLWACSGTLGTGTQVSCR